MAIVRSVDATTGKAFWTRATRRADVRDIAVGPGGGHVFVVGDIRGGRVDDSLDFLAFALDRSGERAWDSRYRGRSGRPESASAVSLAPDRRLVYATGLSERSDGEPDLRTIAYDAFTGATRWNRGVGDRSHSAAAVFGVAAGPLGKRVYVAGETGRSSVTFAYAADPQGRRSARW